MSYVTGLAALSASLLVDPKKRLLEVLLLFKVEVSQVLMNTRRSQIKKQSELRDDLDLL